jgi:succinoglycan biosynthesis transport protein ExoP
MQTPDIPSENLPGPSPRGNAVALRGGYQLQLPGHTAPEEHGDSIQLIDLLRIVLKHKWTLLMVLVVAAGIAGIRTLLQTPIYRSTVTLQIERVAPRVVNFNNEVEQDVYSDETVTLRTQYELLRSRTLAERVIDELNLDRNDTGKGRAAAKPAEAAEAPTTFVGRIVSGYHKLTQPATTDRAVLNREGLIGGFLGAMTVEPVRNSRLIKVHFDNTDPELAARIANATAQAYIAMGLERRTETASYAKTLLEDQIRQVKAKLEESERKLNQYAQGKQILTLDEKTNVINQTYTDFAAAVSKAEQERIKAEAAYNEFRRSPETTPQVVDNKTIQVFKEQKAKLEIEYQQNLKTYKPDFPKMVQLRGQVAEADAQLKAEIASVAGTVRSQYESALKQENLLREKLAQTRKQVLQTQDSSIDLNLLKREVDTNRQLYDGLLQRLKQVGVSSGVATNNVSIVDAAEPPVFPFKPSLRGNIMVGLGIGLVLGLALILLLEYMDDSIRRPDDVEKMLGLPVMGVIPFVKSKRGEENAAATMVQSDPRSSIAEAYRSVRTALQFSTSEGAPKQLVITSTTRDEGKSTTAVALSIKFAQMGQRVLLIDADMRNPSVHKQLEMPNESGLSNLLSRDSRGESLIVPGPVPNLSVLTAGPIPPNPADLLMGPKLLSMLAKAQDMGFDHVIVDAPPVLGIADAIVLGNQIQNVLYVVRASKTRKGHIRDALRRLRLAGINPCGVVLVQSERDSMPQNYESYYGYGEPALRAQLTQKRPA